MSHLDDGVKVWTVSELTERIKSILETSLPSVWVEGEVSDLRMPESGHLYFSLKDEYSQLRCVMFRSSARTLGLDLKNGVKVRVRGNTGVYERQGVYQLYVEEVRPVGVGELAMKFEELKQRLKREGLFDQARKKPLPFFPERLGVVTSSSGAAIRDIIKVARRRCPSCLLIISPVRVQGAGAAEEIAQAIEQFNEYGRIDVMIVGRGGGSMEDLWAFNEERVARAISESRIPVVSAVGHEIDFTIADFTADLRAATPSAAVEHALPHKRELDSQLRSLTQRAAVTLKRRLETLADRLRTIEASRALRRPEDMLREKMQGVDELDRTLHREFTHLLEERKNMLLTSTARLESLNPGSVLARGYSISRRLPDRTVLKDSRTLKRGDSVEIQFHKGKVSVDVRSRTE